MAPSVDAFLATASAAEARRVREVQTHQRVHGMAPRDDSALTLLYARQELDVELFPGAAAVAEELVVVDHIYQTTLYGELLEGVMRVVKARAHRMYPAIPVPQLWAIVRLYVPTFLKLHCLHVCRSEYLVPAAVPMECEPRGDAPARTVQEAH